MNRPAALVTCRHPTNGHINPVRVTIACAVLVAAGCSSDGSGERDTLPDITLFTTTTSTTIALFDEVGETAEPTTTSTTSTTTSTAPTTTTTVAEPSAPETPLELDIDGLGAAAFGADPDGIIGFVSSFIGGPSADTGYVDPFEFGACPGTQARRVSWGSLTLEFGDFSNVATDRLHFYAYQYGTEDPAGLAPGTPLGLETPEGIGYGSTVAELAFTYPETTFLEGSEFISPNFVVNDNLRGLLTGLTDLDIVTVITGGLPCL